MVEGYPRPPENRYAWLPGCVLPLVAAATVILCVAFFIYALCVNVHAGRLLWKLLTS